MLPPTDTLSRGPKPGSEIPMALFRRSSPATYASRTYDNPNWIVRFPHRQRYEFAVKAINAGRPAVVLDYGAGDGHMLVKLLQDSRTDPAMRAIAYEPLPYIRGLLESIVEEQGLACRIQAVGSLDELADRQFECVTCLGVLEHLNVTDRFVFYAFAQRVLAPGGRVLIDVPIELGPTLLIKNLGRRVLKSDAREYSRAETLRAAFGRTVFDPVRWDPREQVDFIMTHKGFDYRLFAQELSGRFRIDQQVNTPFAALPALVANQEVFFVVSADEQMASARNATPKGLADWRPG
jgi:SAM-dependent methyltransferase